MKAVVAAFNQEKARVGAFSVITNLRMELFEALLWAEARNVGKSGKLIRIEILSLNGENAPCRHTRFLGA